MKKMCSANIDGLLPSTSGVYKECCLDYNFCLNRELKDFGNAKIGIQVSVDRITIYLQSVTNSGFCNINDVNTGWIHETVIDVIDKNKLKIEERGQQIHK